LQSGIGGNSVSTTKKMLDCTVRRLTQEAGEHAKNKLILDPTRNSISSAEPKGIPNFETHEGLHDQATLVPSGD